MRSLHQHAQRPAGELSIFDIGRDPAAIGGTVRIARIVPFGSLAAHPIGALQSFGRASVGGHRSASEGFADELRQNRGVGFQPGHFAQHLQAGGDVGDQHVDGAQPMAWLSSLLGWARRGERRHVVAFAGGVLLLAVVVSLAGRA